MYKDLAELSKIICSCCTCGKYELCIHCRAYILVNRLLNKQAEK